MTEGYMYDLDRIRVILEGFRKLPNRNVVQLFGALYEDDVGEEECGACVGAWCAYFLGLPGKIHWDSGRYYWPFENGAMAFRHLLKVRPDRLDASLHANGAHPSPFSIFPWSKNPYDVLCATVLDITGYDHKAYLRDLPVPPKEVHSHETLEAMP